MRDDFRRFPVDDPFGRTWDAEFRWQQNAISIRHADAVDCKYYLSSAGERREVVVSLPHAALLSVARETGRELSDAWVLKLAGLHVERMVSTWEDMDRTIAGIGSLQQDFIGGCLPSWRRPPLRSPDESRRDSGKGSIPVVYCSRVSSCSRV
jgi:hypothetical protein